MLPDFCIPNLLYDGHVHKKKLKTQLVLEEQLEKYTSLLV